MEIHYLDPFITYETLIFLEMLLVFGGLIWFALAQIRAVRRPPRADRGGSSLAREPGRGSADR